DLEDKVPGIDAGQQLGENDLPAGLERLGTVHTSAGIIPAITGNGQNEWLLPFELARISAPSDFATFIQPVGELPRGFKSARIARRMASGISGQRARESRRASGSSPQRAMTRARSGQQEAAWVWSRRGPGAGPALPEVLAVLGD